MARTTLIRVRHLFQLVVAAIGAAAAVSCDIPMDPCVVDYKPGQRISVELIELYDVNSRFKFDKSFADQSMDHPSCQGSDGLGTGDLIDFVILPEKDVFAVSCYFRMADLADKSALSPAVTRQGSRSSTLLNGRGTNLVFSASLFAGGTDGVPGRFWLANVIAPNGAEKFYSEPISGEFPPAIFGRSTVRDSMICVDYFAAKVKLIP